MRIAEAVMFTAMVGCAAPPAEFDAAHQAAQQDSVRNTMAAMASEINAQGFVAWLPYLQRDDQFVWTADGVLAFPSADSLDAFIRGFAPTLTHTELEFLSQRVSAIAPGVAQVAAPYREMFVGQAADTTRITGMFVGLWVNTPGGWRLASGHTSHAAAH